MSECPVCKISPIVISKQPSTDELLVDCTNCGKFILTRLARVKHENRLNDDVVARAVLSHQIRRMQGHSNVPLLCTKDVESYLNDFKLPSPATQAENLILWLGDNSVIPEQTFKLLDSTHRAIAGAASESGFAIIANHLAATAMVDLIKVAGFPNLCRLSFSGWEKYEELRKGRVESRNAFMAMKFGDPELTRVFTQYFVPAVAQAGFELSTVSDNKKAGLIDDKLRVDILTSQFLIADLTHGNQGAYWEAGYAEGLGKPVIYTCRKDIFENEKLKPHFDTNHHLTIMWDPDDITSACEELKATIRATLPNLSKLSDD